MIVRGIKSDLKRASIEDINALKDYLRSKEVEIDIEDAKRRIGDQECLRNSIHVGDCFLKKFSERVFKIIQIKAIVEEEYEDPKKYYYIVEEFTISKEVDITYMDEDELTLPAFDLYSPFPKEKFEKVRKIFKKTENKIESLWEDSSRNAVDIIEN